MKNATITALMTASILIAGCGKKGKSSSSPETRPTVQADVKGVWICQSATSKGKALDEATAKLLTLTLTQDRDVSKRGTDIVWNAGYAVDASHQPPHIDIMDTEGVLKGIYFLTDEMLKICYAEPGKARPTVFDSTAGSGAFLFVWKRQKP